jgi:uncharacterized membrane protein YagU involved in acid resistance
VNARQIGRRVLGRAPGILVGGLVAATIDIGAAALISGRSPLRICQTIAGGVLGKETFAMGHESALLGLVLQEGMGLLIALIYALGVDFTAALRTWIWRGLIYGGVIFAVMNYVVVPLSAWRRFPHFTATTFAENLAAMLLFGLIIAASSQFTSAARSANDRR